MQAQTFTKKIYAPWVRNTA